MQGKTVRKISFFVSAVLLVGAGWFASNFYHKVNNISRTARIKNPEHKFISPLLDVELPEGLNVKYELMPFRHKIQELADQEILGGRVSEMSVYYRSLVDGPWFGVNDRVQYDAASMMKVPVMMAWLKRAEKNPSVFKIKFTFDEKSCPAPSQKIVPEKMLKDGVSYTVEKLLEYMIMYSDNRALWLLFNSISDEEYAAVIKYADVTFNPTATSNMITVHGYSGFFRILYNASFLSEEMSEKALELLSHKGFSNGLLAGVPKGVVVASKFGEFSDDKNPAIQQLHEFGIVYHPKGAYILGVLTRGNDFSVQADIIRRVSQLVYNETSMVNGSDENTP